MVICTLQERLTEFKHTSPPKVMTRKETKEAEQKTVRQIWDEFHTGPERLMAWEQQARKSEQSR